MNERPKLKICGITNLADARYCAAAGIDYLGFIQYEQSARYVEPATVRQITEWVAGPVPVGVFVNEDPGKINEIATAAGFRYIQLHGDESPEMCTAIEMPVIKAIRISPDDTATSVMNRMKPYEAVADLFLLDTKTDDHLYGGTGRRFNWDIASELSGTYRFFLAGGLGPENIEEAATSVQPFGLDLSSSVEEKPGKKDFDRLGLLFERTGQWAEE